ncbi:MAG TPA: hypothetical protein VGD60_00325 [Candidatus Acidoferrales bacterium]
MASLVAMAGLGLAAGALPVPNPTNHAGGAASAAPVLSKAQPAQNGATRNVSVTDPIFNTTAYRYTVPANWIFDGAAVQGSTCGGGVMAVFRAVSPDGLTGIKSLPRVDWAWSDNPVAEKHDEAPDCLPYKQTMTAQEFLQHMITMFHVQFVRLEPVPWLAERQRQTAAQNTANSQSTIDIAIATVNYKINKITIEERIQVNVACHSNLLMGTRTHQNSCNANVLREWAPQGKFSPEIFKPILQSFNIDQQWQEQFTAMMVQQIKDRAAGARAMLDGQEASANRQMQAQYNAFNQAQQMRQQQHDDFLATMQRGTDMSMQRTGDAMNARGRAADDWCDYSLDQQKRLDPNTGQITKDSAAYNYSWVNEQGDRVQTNNINANPNGNGTGNWTLQENVR